MADDSLTSDARIRAVLLDEWDPHNAVRNEAAHGTYDTYIAPIRKLLTDGAGEDALVDYLKEREEETMCFPSLGTRRLRRVAQKLLETRGTTAPSPRG